MTLIPFVWLQLLLRHIILLPTSVSDFPGPGRDVFSIAIVDLISRRALVGFSLLCARYYYNLTVFFPTSFLFTISLVPVSYQYMFAWSYRNKDLLRFISRYCAFIYNEYVILSCFIINHHKTILITQISSRFICYIL